MPMPDSSALVTDAELRGNDTNSEALYSARVVRVWGLALYADGDAGASEKSFSHSCYQGPDMRVIEI
jgi:hypothetical protein